MRVNADFMKALDDALATGAADGQTWKAEADSLRTELSTSDNKRVDTNDCIEALARQKQEWQFPPSRVRKREKTLLRQAEALTAEHLQSVAKFKKSLAKLRRAALEPSRLVLRA